MRRWYSNALIGLVVALPLSAFAERGLGGEDRRPRRAAAHADGPPPAHTGGFGEPTCQECHQGNELNVAPGGLKLTGLPKLYRTDRTYDLTVVLTRPGMRLGGFQLSVRSEGLRRQAGTLTPGDDRTTIPLAPLEYLQHTRAGAGLTSQDTAQWRFTWRPPQGVGPVVFHIAANAANGDNSPLDDFIYTQAIVLQVKP